MSASYPVLVADNIRRPRRSALDSAVARPAGYEPEHSERQVSGSVVVGEQVRWSARLAVSMAGDQSLLVVIEREGPLPPGGPVVGEVAVVIPPGEADAVLALLQGLVEHARRDGVLPTE